MVTIPFVVLVRYGSSALKKEHQNGGIKMILSLLVSSLTAFAAPSTPLTVQVTSTTTAEVHDGAGNVLLTLTCQSNLNSPTTYQVNCPANSNSGNSFDSELIYDESQSQWMSTKTSSLIFDGQSLEMICSAAEKTGQTTPSFQLFVCSQGT
jgi:hypothetical protein